MIGVTQRDNLGRSGIAARGQNRGFVRFRAAVGEERFGQLSARRDLRQFLGQRRLRLVGEDRGDVLQPIDLRVHFPVHLFIAMADADGDDAAEEIQVLIAVGIPNVLILGVRDDQRFLVVVEDAGKQVLALREKDLLFGHV